MIQEKIAELNEIRQKESVMAAMESRAAEPMQTDVSKIPELYTRFQEVCKPGYGDNKRIFVAIVFFLYGPSAFVRKRVRNGKIIDSLAKVMRLSNSAISIYFSQAKILITKHSGFRQEAERTLSLILK